MKNAEMIKDNLIAMEDKYETLVWYARKSEGQIRTIPRVQELVYEVQREYPKECRMLEAMGDWSHGFNSGVLAATRFFLSIENEGIELAEENFPDLDT